jgi:hypothetical protein
MTLHLKEGLDLADGQVLPVPKRHQLVKGAQQFVGILQYLPLVQTLADASDYLGKQV